MNAITYRPPMFRGNAQPNAAQQADVVRMKLISGLSQNLDWSLDRANAIKKWTNNGQYYPVYSADQFATKTIRALAYLVGPVQPNKSVSPD